MKEQNESRSSIGTYLTDVEAALTNLSRHDIVGRIWQKDHTVWKPDPTEITNRLGWLTITDVMADQVSALESFAQEIRDAGFRHLVLLGMGGSSLGDLQTLQSLGRCVARIHLSRGDRAAISKLVTELA